MTQDPEVHAMSKVAEALADLDEEARARVIDWAAKRYGMKLAGRSMGAAEPATPAGEYSEFVDLFDVAQPKTEPERALVGGYWFQVVQGKSTFQAQEVNTTLKDMGQGVGNITDALTSLQDRKPALVRQVSKHGRAKQARKSYKLTTAGVNKVNGMVKGKNGEE